LLGASGGARIADRTVLAGLARPGGRPLPEVSVTASGNLGVLWFPRLAGRIPLEEITVRWPRLVPGLLARAAIGIVVAQTVDRGPVALGARGSRLLADDVPAVRAVRGEDPLAPFGPQARADLLRAAGLAHAGDLILISAVDARGSVHAFEELVGSHGGLGGAQNDALLLYPAEWTIGADLPGDVGGDAMLVGAEVVYTQLVRWQRALGLRP
jgi:hypothetical protein